MVGTVPLRAAPKGGTVRGMASKQKPGAESKKPGRSIKEKRAQKHEKQVAQKQLRKSADSK
jgi:hypothetical protein